MRRVSPLMGDPEMMQFVSLVPRWSSCGNGSVSQDVHLSTPKNVRTLSMASDI